METEPATPPPPRSGLPFSVLLIVVVAMSVALALLLRQSVVPAPAAAGQAPRIEAEGWLNGDGPTDEQLKGKVIVLDAWAYWCNPCRAAAPELVKLHQKYKDRGVVFLGLTSEGADTNAFNRRFLEATRITWPNGYGAGKTLSALNVEFIPQRWVIDRHNTIIWNEMSRESIESAIDRALAESP